MKKVTRKDAVKEYDSGWFGATGSDDPKVEPRRLFRTKEEAEIADSLFMLVTSPKPKKDKK